MLTRLTTAALAAWIFTFAASAQTAVPQPKMGAPIRGLSPTEMQRFVDGRARFTQSIPVAQGLGPTFNQQSCGSCHNNPVGGSGTIFVTRFGTLDFATGAFDPMSALGGSLLQSQALSTTCMETVPPSAIFVAQRVTNSTLGMGLVEAIPDAAILANASTPPSPNVSGIVHMVQPLEDPTGPLRVGRFGWKAQVATTLTFAGDAALNEMGFTNRLLPTESAPNGNPALLVGCDNVADPEDGPDAAGLHFIDRVTDFQRFLAPPPQTPKSGMTGEALFVQVGCADCHRQSFTTSNSPMLEAALRNQTIRPYSDFLLHDMGLASDFIEQDQAGQQEMRTPSLWGVRSRDPLWHDGRVAGGTLTSRILGANGVIAQHNALFSESVPSAMAFLALSSADQMKIVAFLNSLGRTEFDQTGDNQIRRADALAFKAARSTTPIYTADSPEAVFDIDQDGDVDDQDFAAMIQVYEDDLNFNGQNDLIDIFVTGQSFDANQNFLPDESEFCQPNIGFAGPGSLELSVCGDLLAMPGSAATGLLEGAVPSGQIFLIASATLGNYPLPGGGILSPGAPFLLVFETTADANGRFVTTIPGGGAPIAFIAQGVQVRNGIIELSNAVYVAIGM